MPAKITVKAKRPWFVVEGWEVWNGIRPMMGSWCAEQDRHLTWTEWVAGAEGMLWAAVDPNDKYVDQTRYINGRDRGVIVEFTGEES